MASIVLASGRQMGSVTGTTNEETTSSIGHSKQSAVDEPGRPHSKNEFLSFFLRCMSHANEIDFLEEDGRESARNIEKTQQ